jgi:hypothetical protein
MIKKRKGAKKQKEREKRDKTNIDRNQHFPNLSLRQSARTLAKLNLKYF